MKNIIATVHQFTQLPPNTIAVGDGEYDMVGDILPPVKDILVELRVGENGAVAKVFRKPGYKKNPRRQP